MRKKEEDTAIRISRRKYEERNKEERRKNNANFQTMIPRADYDKINIFLKKYNITKVELIYAGVIALWKEKNKDNPDGNKDEIPFPFN